MRRVAVKIRLQNQEFGPKKLYRFVRDPCSEPDMPIRYQHVETVATTPDRAFAAIDDLPLTANGSPRASACRRSATGRTPPATSSATSTSRVAGRARWRARSSPGCPASGCTVSTPTALRCLGRPAGRRRAGRGADHAHHRDLSQDATGEADVAADSARCGQADAGRRGQPEEAA